MTPDPDRWTYVLARCGCLAYVKVGRTRDPLHRRSTVGEDRTATPPAARHRSPIMLGYWPETDGPTEADLLDRLADHRWTSRTGHRSEYVTTTAPAVRDLLADVCPDWRQIVACDPASLRPLLAPWQTDDRLPIPTGTTTTTGTTVPAEPRPGTSHA